MHNLLHAQGLERFYALAGDQVSSVTARSPRSHSRLEPLVAHALLGEGPLATLQFDVQGIHCAACVWLMRGTFRRHSGAADITVNPTLGTVRVHWKKGELELERWVKEVEAFRYRFGPARKEGSRRSVDLPVRLGISAAIAINVMLFSVSFYFGLSPDEPEVHRALVSALDRYRGDRRLALLSSAARVLYLDLPIALVYAMSAVQLVTSEGRGDFAYLDTLNLRLQRARDRLRVAGRMSPVAAAISMPASTLRGRARWGGLVHMSNKGPNGTI